MIKEFKEFILTGNVIDLAVGVILAGAVGAVTGSFVSDIAMPFVGHLVGGVDFSELKVVLDEAIIAADGSETTPENAIAYGKLITAFINLVMVGLVLFIIVKAYNKSKAPEPEAAPAGPSELDILMEIRDNLKK